MGASTPTQRGLEKSCLVREEKTNRHELQRIPRRYITRRQKEVIYRYILDYECSAFMTFTLTVKFPKPLWLILVLLAIIIFAGKPQSYAIRSELFAKLT